MIKKLCCLFVCVFILSSLQAAELITRVVQLQHRFASDLVLQLEPLLIDTGSITGMNDQLIIRTSSSNMKDILGLLKTLDQAQRSLKISVQFRSHTEQIQHGSDIEAYYDSRNVHIESRSTQSAPQRSLSSRNRDDQSRGEVKYRSWQTQDRGNDNDVYFIRTIEGNPAWIRTGKSVPVTESTVRQDYYDREVYTSTSYEEVNSGFYVVPHLHGTRVTLVISPQQARQDRVYASRFQTYEAETTINAKLGEWVELGGVSTEYHDRRDETTYRSHRSGQKENHIFVKVELIN